MVFRRIFEVSTVKYVWLLFILLPVIGLAGNDNKKQFTVTKLADNVYQHVSYKHVKSLGYIGASGLIVIDGTDAHIIDSAWTTESSKSLIKWIETNGFTAKSAVFTHFHDDASNDIALFNELQIKTYATTLTNQLLGESKKQSATQEIIGDNINLVGDKIQVFYPGAGHSKDNIVVWLPEAGILFGGCFVKSLSNRSLGYTGDAVIEDWPQSVQNVMERFPDIKVVVTGHGRVGDTSLLLHTQKLAVDVLAASSTK